jgi:predicted permease
MNSIVFFESLWQDVRYSLRTLSKSPAFTLVVISSLALGIGANTAIFSLINAALLKMLPVRNPEQLVEFKSISPAIGLNDAFPYPAFKEFRDRSQTLSGVLAFRKLHDIDFEVNGQGGLANGQVVSGDSPGFAATGTPYDGARLKLGVTNKRAMANLEPIFREAMREAAEGLSGLPFDSPAVRKAFIATTLQLDSGGQGLAALRQQFSKPLLIVMAVVALLLLVTCANVANLLLARANARQKEIAVRLTVGAGRLRLIRQLITESVLLAVGGGGLGLLLAFWAGRSLLVLMSHSRSPISLNVEPDSTVLGFTLLVSILTALLFGIIPAWRSVQLDLTPGLVQTTRGSSRVSSGSRLVRPLVILQIAVSLVLMIGAGLLTRSLENLKDFYPGFNKGNVLLLSLDPGMTGYKEAQLVPLYERLVDRFRAIPGVRLASFSVHGPLSTSFSFTTVTVQGYKPRSGKELAPVGVEVAGPDYFRTLETPVLRGRDFTAADRVGSPKVTIVNETMARYYFGDADPIGRRFSMPGYRGDSSWLEIIAVVKDAKYHDLREQATPMAYIPLLQSPESGVTFEVRTAMNPGSAAKAVVQAVKQTDGRLPVYGVKTLSDQLDDSLVEERLVASLSTMFGALALVLACVGLYGLMAYAVNRRTNEIGIRMALGAKRVQIAGMVLRETLLLIILGLAIGIPAAMAASRLIASELYGLKPGYPITILIASSVMAGIAALAGYLPARRASKVDPMVALRYE